MSLTPTAAQRQLRQRVRRFAEHEVRPRVPQMIATEEFPRDLYARCGELGLWRIGVPAAQGGQGGGLTESCIALEELSRVSPALALSVEIGMVTLPLLLTTDAAVHAESIMNGELVVAGGSTDPRGQSNTTEWDVFARRKGNDYVLDGTRLYVTNATSCDLFGVSGLDEDRRMRKFYVPLREVEGVVVEHSTGKFGMAGNGSGAIHLKNCRVPARMSAPFTVGSSPYYHHVYVLCAAQALGCMEGLFEETCEYLRRRTRGGRPLAEMQAVAHRLVRLRLDIEACRSAVYDAATAFDESSGGDAVAPEEVPWSLKAETAKVVVSETAVRLAHECIAFQGGHGYHDAAVHHRAGDALTYRIMDLTNEIHFDDIARTLGLTGMATDTETTTEVREVG